MIDGHHRVLVSTYLGVEKIPVHVADDLSALSQEEFRETMQGRGWAYWRDYKKSDVPMVDLCDMENDPNFYLARIVLYRVKVKKVDGKWVISDPRGSDLPIAIKINKDIPFLEMYIADALRRAEVVWDESRSKQSLTEEELQGFLNILRKEAKDKREPLSQVLLLDRPTPVAELNLGQLLQQHQRSCTRDLSQ